MRTLLTGFGPFGKVVDNPSGRIVEHFARSGAPGHALTARVLPVSFTLAGEAIRELLRDGRFGAALLLGVAGKETCLRLERYARRRPAERPDVDGSVPTEGDGLPGAADGYAASVPLEALQSTLTGAGLSARLSDDAGDYVCNHTYYAALDTLAAEGIPTRCLFIHVPPDEVTHGEPAGGPCMPLQRQIQAVSLALAWLVELAHETASPPARRVGL